MTFVNSATQEHSIKFSCSTQLNSFSVQGEHLIFTCECGKSIDCIEMLSETLFPLNALCDSRFHNFVFAMESKLVSQWTDNFIQVIPISSGVLPSNTILSIKELGDFISYNFDIPYYTSMLFQELNLELEKEGEDYPLIFYNGLLKISYGCKFPLLQYYEKGMMGLIYQCKNCFKLVSYDTEGNLQYFKDL